MACGTNMSVCFPPLTTFVNKSPDTLETQYESNAKTGHSHLSLIVFPLTWWPCELPKWSDIHILMYGS